MRDARQTPVDGVAGPAEASGPTGPSGPPWEQAPPPPGPASPAGPSWDEPATSQWNEPAAPPASPWNEPAPPPSPASPSREAPSWEAAPAPSWGESGPAAPAPSGQTEAAAWNETTLQTMPLSGHAVDPAAPPRSPGPPPPRARAGRRRESWVAHLPYLVVLACTVAGCLWAWRGEHDVGSGAEVVGGGLLAAAIGRLVLPHSAVGLLASRRRFADVLALGALGAGLLVLALVLPPT
jgi:hypothetical protein